MQRLLLISWKLQADRSWLKTQFEGFWPGHGRVVGIVGVAAKDAPCELRSVERAIAGTVDAH